MRAKFINEKFTEKSSDPLKDMGIGLKRVIIDRATDMFKDAQYEDEDGDRFRLVEICFDEFTADVITNYPFAVKATQKWLVDEFKTHELDEFFELETSITHSESDDHIFWNIDFKEKYEMIFSMEDRIVINYKTINESLNEKFTETSDPVVDMGIGAKAIDWASYFYEENFGLTDEQVGIKYFGNIPNKAVLGGILRSFFIRILSKDTPQDAFLQACTNSNYYGSDLKVVEAKNLLRHIIKKKFNIKINESLNEKFSEEGDPIAQMGIGIRNKIDEYIKKHDDFNDVNHGISTPAMFIEESTLDDETKKDWIEFLLREGNENFDKWEEDQSHNMFNNIRIEFIPNSKELPDENFKYEIKNDEYYLYVSEWVEFVPYLDIRGDVDESFITDVLESDARKYFESNYYEPQTLDAILDALYKDDETELFDYLKPFCLEYSSEANNAKDIYELFEIIGESEDLSPVYNALRAAYADCTSDAEENAAFEEITETIKRGLSLQYIDYDVHDKFKFKTTKDALNLIAQIHLTGEDKIIYWPPQYGWDADFNLQHFKEYFEEALM